MKKIAVVTALVAALALAVSVKPASAWHGHHHHHGYRYGYGNFWGGFAAGTFTGLAVGALTAPQYVAPQPVYVYPSPVCRDIQTGGYWRQVPVVDPAGFITYQNQWVPAIIQRVCQ